VKLKKLLVRFLDKYDLTLAELSAKSGMSLNRLESINNEPLRNYQVSIIRALSTLIGRSTSETLAELESLEASYDQLLGFRQFLESKGLSFPELEYRMYVLIQELDEFGVGIENFSFNRFDEEKHGDLKKDSRISMENAITMLEKALDSVKRGQPPYENF
jgi:hypothetical protein